MTEGFAAGAEAVQAAETVEATMTKMSGAKMATE